MDELILKITLENRPFEILAPREATIERLKLTISKKMFLKLDRIILCNLTIPDNLTEKDCTIGDLNLPPDFVLKIEDKFHLWGHQPIKMFGTPRESKKLVLLDVDNTICDEASPNPENYGRPHLQELLKEVYKFYDIGLWSATNMLSIERKANSLGLMENPNYQLLLFVEKSAMGTTVIDGKCVFVKPLSFIWEKFKCYNPGNTLIVDDKPCTFYLNSKNGIKVEPYHYSNFGNDDELKKLSAYLTFILQYDDFSTVDHTKWREHI